MEQQALNTVFLATRTLGDWLKRIFGPNTPGSVMFLVLLVMFAFLIVLLIGLGAIFKTVRDTWRLFRWLHITRDKTFVCMHCGYDLRHRPDRCPECGERVWFSSRRNTPPPIPPPTEEDLSPIELEPDTHPELRPPEEE